jgi:hypothetical protein
MQATTQACPGRYEVNGLEIRSYSQFGEFGEVIHTLSY